jgi:hypothetical protein
MNSNNPLLIDYKTFICTKLNNIQIYHAWVELKRYIMLGPENDKQKVLFI